MRLTFTNEEYDLFKESFQKHGEDELMDLLLRKLKESLPSREAYINKQNAGINARKKVERKNNNRIDIAIGQLKRKKEKITVTSVSKEAGIAYNTAKKYKVRIQFAETDRNRTNDLLLDKKENLI